MKIELKEIVDQLTAAVGLSEGYKVAANISEDEHITGWTIVKVEEDGTLIPQWSTTSLRELLQHYL